MTPSHCTIVIASFAYLSHEMYFIHEIQYGIELKWSKFIGEFFVFKCRLHHIYLSFIKTPDVIKSETSNGTRNAIAKSTDLNAIEKKQPAKKQLFESTFSNYTFKNLHFFYHKLLLYSLQKL